MDDECGRLLAELSDLLHGEVTPERKAAIDAHLRSCPPCLERADFQAHLRQVIASRCCEQVPDALRERVWAALRAEMPGGDSPVTGAPS